MSGWGLGKELNDARDAMQAETLFAKGIETLRTESLRAWES